MTKLTFLGTGTSQGTPVIGCKCWVCTSADDRDKRLRSSVLIEQNGVRLVVDTGPDFRTQMLREGVDRVDAILYTHEHKDHTGGLDDVRAFNYTMRRSIPLYAEERVLGAIQRDFDYAFGESRYPGVMDVDLHRIDEQPFSIQGVEIIPIRGGHYHLSILGFRIGGIAYLTDFNRIDPMEIEKLKGVEVLVINALRKEPHISHFTLGEALHVAYLVGAPRTYLTHVSHQMGRYAQEDPQLPEGCHFAYDGLVVRSEL